MTFQASFLLNKVCNSTILINSHSNLNYSAGDTIMISNYMNTLMKNNNKVTLLSKYAVGLTFIRNLEYKNYNIIIKKNNEEIIKEIDNQAPKNNFIFIRNHEILDNLKNKPYLNKTLLYGLDIHLESIKKLDNKFLCLITQSEKLKELYIKNGIYKYRIVIIEPFAYKYNFNLPERNDNEIRLIYCGTLREEENIIEIIEEFKKIHQERPEALLKIVYGKIHGNQEFTQKVNMYIKEGVKGITFKHNLSHRDACCEIATSDIGICWRKNGWGSNGEISTKMKEYEMYGLCVCNTLLNINIIHNINYILNKSINNNNIIILNKKNISYECLYIKAYSKTHINSQLKIIIDNKELIESNILLPKDYITPNFIDYSIINNFKFIYIYGNMISNLIVENIERKNIFLEENYKCNTNNEKLIKYKFDKIFLNNIAFIGDKFTYTSLSSIINIKYISKNDIHTIDVNLYDFLLCESTWHGMDGSWKYVFNLYEKSNYSCDLKYILSKFKKSNKKCIFYNKEDPTNFEKFKNSAELFDIIITTSNKCIKNYKQLYPDKIILAYPFLCNPIIHNPINNKKENEVYFIGGFYNHLHDRTNKTNIILKKVIDNNYKLKIINRHYFFPKLTRQIKIFNEHIGKYEISDILKNYEYPSISHEEAVSSYKKSLFHININTVEDCETMSSRRLMELLGCGCNILSNKSKSIDNLNLPVLTDIFKYDKNIMNEYNIEGFYLTHTKYSYITLIKEILNLCNVKFINNIKIKITSDNELNIPEKYKNLLKSTNFDFEIFLDKLNYYNVEIIDKLLVYPYFFDGNICFTNNKNKYFTIENGLINNNCVIKYNKETKQSLFIPYIKILYENCFSYILHYDRINITSNINPNSVFVVICLWKRIYYLKNTLEYLENQNIDKLITLCIWNNNKDAIKEINKIIQDFKGKKVKVIVHHSQENIGGIGRFVFTKYICEKKTHFENVIFIDDDQIFENNCIEILLNQVKKKESYHWSGKKFYKDRGYWNSWSNIWPKLRNDIDNTNFNDNYLHYGGTGFMIINTECFLMDDFYQFNERYKFIEDLWMSYFIINKLGYKLQNGKDLKNKVQIISGENNNSIAQVNLLKPLKDEFLKVLRNDGEWDV